MPTTENKAQDWKARLVSRFASRLDSLEQTVSPNAAFYDLELAVDDVGRELQTSLLEAMATRREAAAFPPGLPQVRAEDAAQRPGSSDGEEPLG